MTGPKQHVAKPTNPDAESDADYKERILTRAIARAAGELERLRAENAELKLRMKWREGELDIYKRLFRKGGM